MGRNERTGREGRIEREERTGREEIIVLLNEHLLKGSTKDYKGSSTNLPRS